MKIAVTGARGLVGSRVLELLDKKHEFLPLSSQDIDIRERHSIDKFLKGKNIDVLIHMAAKTDVDGSEMEKDLGKESEVWNINVTGTRNIAEFCKENAVKLVHISTDFVFDGKKPVGEFYTEDDVPNPINFYAITKYEAEKAVEEAQGDFVILRIAYPYRAHFEQKKDFVRAILDRLRQGLPIAGVEDHIMCPTFIDDAAFAIDSILEHNGSGIYHAVGSEDLSPYEAIMKIVEVFRLKKDLILKTTREEYFRGKARRPFNLSLKNGRIEELGIRMKTFQEGLQELRNI